MIRVVGIGGPVGDDRAGLEAAARLAGNRPDGVEVILAERPGAGLLELFDPADAVVLIDAVRSGACPGTLHDLELREVPASSLRSLSSHGIGVAEALALGAALGRLPARGRLIGVEAGLTPGGVGVSLSPAVEQALAAVIERVCAWAHSFGSPVARW
jgi:hydrogenase maturation protease